MLTRLVRTSAVALAAAAILVQTALAWGEPKNEWPFPRSVAGRATRASVDRTSNVDTPIQGEPKNNSPFTGPETVVIVSSRGFDWTSGAIGGAAGLGAAVLATGGVLLVAGRKSARPA